jgi:hypothetical protein
MCGYLTRLSDKISFFISGNTEESKKLSDDGRLLPKHVGANI